MKQKPTVPKEAGKKEKSKIRGAKRDSNRMRIRGVVSVLRLLGGRWQHRSPHVRIPTLYNGLLCPILVPCISLWFILVHNIFTTF